MESYIYERHSQIHILDLRETIRGVIRASHFLTRLTEAGHDVVFVGTKSQAREIVRDQATRCGMHWVTNRWLGGTLTNFHTIRSRLRRLEELEALEADGSINLRSKKEISSLRRERRKIHRNLEGIRRMGRLPGAMIVVDIRRDDIAVAEARLLGIPVVAIVDSDCDPDQVDIAIPGNDDAYRSIEIVLQALADAIIAGRDKLITRQEAEERKRLEEEAEQRRRAESRSAASPAAPKGDAPPGTDGAPAPSSGSSGRPPGSPPPSAPSSPSGAPTMVKAEGPPRPGPVSPGV